MSTLSDFSPGDRVFHPGCGEGDVVRVDGAVYVMYGQKGRHGENWRGIYDRGWFETYPELLRKIARATPGQGGMPK